MNTHEFALFALQIATMLGCAVLFGQLMRKMGQPAVLGEMIGGIILGPTIFGTVAPALFADLFYASANVTMVREASIKMGMLFFLFVAGLEINLGDLRRLGRKVALIGSLGTLIPIGVGIGLVYLLPRDFWGTQVQAHFFAFALFVGMNLANSANPVIARILMDLGLLKEEIGTVIMSATVIDDLVNWTLFAIILSNITPSGEPQNVAMGIMTSFGLVLVFFVGVLVLGRWVGRRGLHWIRSRVPWPTGFIAVTTLVILMAASVAENLGIHAFLGAFLVGVALGGGTGREQHQAHDVIAQFAMSFFVPIYFVSLGLSANFLAHFDFTLVALLVVVACASKIGAVLLGAWSAGMPLDRNTLAIGFGLNARGATGIILAGVGLAYHVIDERIFVAMVLMALTTTLLSSPMIRYLLAAPAFDAIMSSETIE